MSAVPDRRLLGAAAAWIVAAVVGFVPLVNYAQRPGPSGVAPPSRVKDGRARLLMALHPQCSCSHASVRELERLLSHVAGPLDAHILFVGERDDGALLDQAMGLASVVIEHDRTGARAHALGLETSGDVLYYDASGTLRYHGGLTTARGHEGGSPGYDAIIALSANRATTTTRAPAFGCGLTASP